MRYWHFTSLGHAEAIESIGIIFPTESNVSFTNEHHGPDVVWLLDTPTIEFGHGLVEGKTRARFEVDVPAVKWTDWEWTHRMEGWVRDILIKTGGGVEAAEHWYVFPAPIPSSRWRGIERNLPVAAEGIFEK